MRHLSTHAALLALAAALAGPALGADPPKKASFGAGKSGTPVLTREELRACFARQAKVAQLDEQLPKEKAQLAATQDELLKSGESMKATLEALDKTDEQAVNDFNAKSQARDKRIEEHQAHVADFNVRVQAVQVERDAFLKACANRDFFEEDAAAIRRGK